MIPFLNKIISWSFYALFFAVPLAFTGDTSELFEFNKMWLTFGLTIIIVAAWGIKMILERKIHIQRTPLDIPIVLFLASQLISTFMSLDPHTSLWGYYSRFNGGFLSLITYTLLYYAFVSNDAKDHTLSYLKTMIISGILVALWGLPSHFGYDPTCLVFRGNFDVSCWTVDFQPKVRIFSTLGQPDWLSAYLAALIPISIGLGMLSWIKKQTLATVGYLLATLLFYLDFLYAKSRAGFVGIAISLVLFFAWYLWRDLPAGSAGKKHISHLIQTPKKFLLTHWYVLVTLFAIVVISFLVGTSIDQIDKFTLPNILSKMQSQTTVSPKTKAVPSPTPQQSSISTQELGGTDSGKIRLFVWQGAIAAWKHYPIFGTGVETFAYAYYLFMPPGHNLTSEFGFLYNKAHNEYLNYLATTGIVGLGTYLLMIGWFVFIAVKRLILNSNIEYRNSKQYQNTNDKNAKHLEHSNFENSNLFRASDFGFRILLASLLASYIGILIINFFGFSVVIINVFLFLFPAFVFSLQGQINPEKSFSFPKSTGKVTDSPSLLQWIFSAGVGLVAIYFLYTLLVFWQADKAYALGQNLVNSGDYQGAYQPLHQAAEARPSEPTFLDELSLDDAILSVALVQQNKKVTDTATQLAQESVAISNNLTTTHPNIVTYWKTRVRIMYSLAQLNPQYMQDALSAIQKAAQLAPTDAKVSYNLGLILGQTGQLQQAVDTLQNTIKLKDDYRDAYYGLGIFYRGLAVDKNGKLVNDTDNQKAIAQMRFILQNFNAKDQQALAALKAWGAQ